MSLHTTATKRHSVLRWTELCAKVWLFLVLGICWKQVNVYLWLLTLLNRKAFHGKRRWHNHANIPSQTGKHWLQIEIVDDYNWYLPLPFPQPLQQLWNPAPNSNTTNPFSISSSIIVFLLFLTSFLVWAASALKRSLRCSQVTFVIFLLNNVLIRFFFLWWKIAKRL